MLRLSGLPCAFCGMVCVLEPWVGDPAMGAQEPEVKVYDLRFLISKIGDLRLRFECRMYSLGLKGRPLFGISLWGPKRLR